MSATDDLIENSKKHAHSSGGSDLPSPPRKKVAVVACMDARLGVSRVLGLEEGDAHVIRNAGGVVTDQEIRSLAISQHLLGTEEIMVIQHTDCGMLTFTDDEFQSLLEERAGQRPDWNAEAFDNLEESVRACVERIEASPFIPHKNVRGFIYDVKTAALREVTG
jgi:carbonic anhydrase